MVEPECDQRHGNEGIDSSDRLSCHLAARRKRTVFSVRSVWTQPDEYKKLDTGPSHVQVLAGMKTSCLHFSAFGLVLAAALLAAGCAQVPARSAQAASQQPLARIDLPAGSANGKASALLIAAEFALQDNDTAKATTDYAEAAQISSDPAIAKRAVQLALMTRNADAAQRLLGRWQALGASPHDLELARGQLAMLQGDRADAEHQFDLLLASGNAEDWKTFAAALLTARDSALAGRVLEDVAKPDRLPADEGVWVVLSQLGEHLGRHAFARQLADAAVKRFDGADSIRWAASLELENGDRAGAQALYAKGVAAHPRNPDLRLGYASLLGEAGKYDQALQVLARGPQTSATWSARVGIAARARNAGALRRLYAELQRAPARQRDDNAFLLGQLAELLHHDDQALTWYGRVDPDGQHGFEAQVRSAVLLDKAGKSAQAHALATQLQQDYADDPDSLRTAYELDAQMYSQDGQHAKAIAAYDRGLQALPGDPVLIYDRGIEEANAGNTDAALADFRKVLAQNPDNVDAMNALGFTLADADRDLPEAAKLLRKALAAKPDTAAIMDSWGWLQYRLGNLDEAEAYLRRAWGRQQDPDIGVHLGEVLWKLGQHQHAQEVFAKVRKLDPHNQALLKAERKLNP
ncbi:MAG: tetratricopeptide repeat protein [Rhodanobacteraceae bacterium]|nr:MAG: tetratricopeptide repeat protein [Rhodanobacteraceae bacterium]